MEKLEEDGGAGVGEIGKLPREGSLQECQYSRESRENSRQWPWSPEGKEG